MPESANPKRPDLDEKAWRRAWNEARHWNLDSLVGGFATLAFGGAGAAWASTFEIKSDALEVVVVTAAGIAGAVIGLIVYVIAHRLLVPGRQRDELREYLRAREESEGGIAGFKARCFRWADNVERLYDAQEAKAPPSDASARISQMVRTGKPAPSRTDETRSRIQRETISLYIERYRDEGIELIDQVIAAGRIGSGVRPVIAAPKQPLDLFQAADHMRTAGDRI